MNFLFTVGVRLTSSICFVRLPPSSPQFVSHLQRRRRSSHCLRTSEHESAFPRFFPSSAPQHRSAAAAVVFHSRPPPPPPPRRGKISDIHVLWQAKAGRSPLAPYHLHGEPRLVDAIRMRFRPWFLCHHIQISGSICSCASRVPFSFQIFSLQ